MNKDEQVSALLIAKGYKATVYVAPYCMIDGFMGKIIIVHENHIYEYYRGLDAIVIVNEFIKGLEK